MRADMTKLQLENSSMSRRMVEVEKSCQTIRNEPRHEKTNIQVSDLVRHKPGCTAREDG